MKEFLVIALLFSLGVVYAQLDVDDLEGVDDSVLREKCDSRGGKGTYDKVQTARDTLQTCIEELVDLETLKKEIEESKKTGSMDEVFGKYCRKRPDLKKCLNSFLEKMKLCLVDDEKKNLDSVLEILRELGDFACYKDGDRIAMFVAEEGPECIKAHVEGIKTCVNNTLKLSPSNSVDSLPSFLNATKVCDDMAQVQPCIVAELEKCENTTPANVVDSVFRFIKKRACKSGKTKRSILSKRSLLSTSISLKKLINAYVKYVRAKCKTNKGEDGVRKLQESMDKTQTCISDHIKENMLQLLNPEDLKKIVLECSEDFIEASEDCLCQSEKYYPKFSQEITNGLVDLIFKYKNNLTTSTWDSEVQMCLQNFKHNPNKQELMKCFEEDLLEENAEYTKEYVCERLSEASKCVTGLISDKCVKDVNIDQFKKEFTDVFTKPCDSVNEE